MESLVTEAQLAEKQFDQKLANTSTPLDTVIAHLRKFRSATDEILECDFLYARTSDVETRLWGAHSRLKARLSNHLSMLRKDRSNKPVEFRKFIKFYLEFLKDSLRYYREYIQKLNARFGGIAELQRIARQVKSEIPDASLQPQISSQVQAQVILSCYQTLIYLGDLFRYRAVEKLDKTPDWGPAIGYYALAASVRPGCGNAYHQQSALAFEQSDYLRSTYYLYRAINVDEPHPNAGANLELQFKKITSGWDKGHLVPKNLPNDKSASRKALIAWFVRFHSLCYKGTHFSQYEELEQEVISRTASELRNGTLDGALPKMLFINFAAQHTAASQLQKTPTNEHFMQSYFFFLRLNLKFFITLLESLGKDLEKLSGQDNAPKVERKLSLARHVLPCLRLSSSWLLCNAQIAAAQVGDDILLQTSARLWTTYASTMSAVVAVFPFSELPSLGYQLEEDVDAFAFTPLTSERTHKLWLDPVTRFMKPKFDDPDLPRLDVDIEMLARVRELVVDAMLLAVDENTPITFDGSKFTVDHASSQALKESLAPQLEHISISQPAPQPAPQQKPIPDVLPHQPTQQAQKTQSKPYTREDDLMNMVDNLVGPEEDEVDVGPAMAPIPTFTPSPVYPAENGGFYMAGTRSGSFAQPTSPSNYAPVRTPELRHAAEGWQSSNSPMSKSPQPLQSVSSIWNDTLAHNTSPMTPNLANGLGLPRTGSNASAHLANGYNHVRIPSTSLSPKTGLPPKDGWSSLEPTPLPANNAATRYDQRMGSLHTTGAYNGMNSPLLFGAGGSPWSTTPRGSLSNYTPPNGQGG